MKSIIEVPLYSIGEADGLNTAVRQRTFREAVIKMYQSGGMYIVLSRDKCYGRYKTLIKQREEPVTYIFGKEFSIDEGKQMLNTSGIRWIESVEEKGFKSFVYCSRAAGTQFMPVGENDIVLSDGFCRKLAGENVRLNGKAWLLSEPVFRVIGQEKSDFCVLSEITTKMKYDDIIGFEAFSCVYYSDATFDVEGEGRQYVFEDAVVEKSSLHQLFSHNKNILRRIDSFKGEAMILDNDNQVYPLRENYVPLRRCFVNTWNR